MDATITIKTQNIVLTLYGQPFPQPQVTTSLFSVPILHLFQNLYDFSNKNILEYKLIWDD